MRVGVGDMTKFLYHDMSNSISRSLYIVYIVILALNNVFMIATFLIR